jgi:hypothetical protein
MPLLRDDLVMGISAREKLPIASPFVSLSTHMLIALTAGTLRARCLFSRRTEFLVCMDSRNAVHTQEIRGRDGLRSVFENLSTYEATTHFNGQSPVTWAQDSATGVSYCLAHHVKVDGPRRSLMIASIRYLDHFVKMDGHWYSRQRKFALFSVPRRKSHDYLRRTTSEQAEDVATSRHQRISRTDPCAKHPSLWLYGIGNISA